MVDLLKDRTSAQCYADSLEQQASKLELVGRLTSGIVHDFNNLLSVQLHIVAMLQNTIATGTAEAEHLHTLQLAIQQGSALTNRLLAVVRPDKGLSPRPVDLNEICAEAVELLKHNVSPHIALETSLAPSLPPVHAEAGQLMRVVLNLCFNARDAMPRGGRLSIETEIANREHQQKWDGGTIEGGEFVCLTCRDTGEGMTPEVRAHIFEWFYTTKDAGQGSGLGLSIVADIVERLGGWIECDSKLGEGTRFTVCLPIAATETVVPVAAIAPSRPSAQKSILVIDREPSIVRMAQLVLACNGYRVLPAMDGLQAMELYRESPTAIDLVVFEYHMAGLGGKEILLELATLNPYVRVLALAGGPVPESEWMNELSGWGILSKPFDADQLVQAVRDVLAVDMKEEG